MDNYAFSYRKLFIQSVCMLFSFSVMANASEQLAFSEENFFDINAPVVISATRLVQPRSEVPGSLTVITRDMIEASGRREIVDLLRLVPGFQVGHDTFRPAATYHGFSDKYQNRLQVLIDGRSVYSPLFGGIDWNDLSISIDDIEKIEVFRGPNAVTYGANSFVAVVNIITRHPSTISGSEVRVEAGDTGYKRVFARHASGSDNFKYRFSYEGRESETFEETPYAYDRQKLNLRSEYLIDSRNTFEFAMGYNGGDHETGSATSLAYPEREKNIENSFQQLRWKRQLAGDEEISLQFYHNHASTLDDYDAGGSPHSLSSNIERYNLEFLHTLRLAEQLRVNWGLEARRDEIDGVNDLSWFGGEVITNDLYRLFFNSEWQASENVLVNTGLMAEDNDISGSDISPRLAINYRVNRNQSMRVVASKATRTPSAIEALSDYEIKYDSYNPPPPSVGSIPFNGNKDTRAEVIKSYELGYLFSNDSKSMVFDTRLFKEKMEDVSTVYASMFTVAPGLDVPIAFYNSNDGEIEITGVEFELKYRPTLNTSVHMTYSTSTAEGFVLASQHSVSGQKTYADVKDTVPKHTASMLVNQKMGENYQFGLGYYYVDTMRWMADGALGLQIDSYEIVDARLSRKFKFDSSEGQVELILLNGSGDYVDFADAHGSKAIENQVILSMGLKF